MVDALNPNEIKETVHTPSDFLRLPKDQWTPQQVRQVLGSNLSWKADIYQEQVQKFAKLAEEFRDLKLWRHFDVKSWDEFCEKHYQKPSHFVEEVIHHRDTITDKDSWEDIEMLVKIQTSDNPELITKRGGNNNPIGSNQYSKEGGQAYINISLTKDGDDKRYGTDRSYLSKKVAALANPNHPDHKPEYIDIYKRMVNKEITPYGAAKKMGISKERKQRLVAITIEPENLATNLKSKCDPDYLSEMAKSLGFIAVEGQTGGDISSDLYVKLDDQQLRELYVNLCDYLGNDF